MGRSRIYSSAYKQTSPRAVLEADKGECSQGVPKKYLGDWSGLPNHLDAAFTWQDTGSTYIYKGEEYCKFQNMDPEPGYSKLISEGFPGIPSSVDTAFVWGGNNKIYFFKENQYWKFDPQRKPHVRSDVYPKDIRDKGGPSRGHGGSTAVGQWKDLLLQRRKLLEVQRQEIFS